MANKSDLAIGQRVRFLRSHDRNVELTGSIVRIHEDSDSVDVETEPDGRIAEVSTTETAHASDVTVLAEVHSIEQPPADESGAESSEEDSGTHGRRRRGRS